MDRRLLLAHLAGVASVAALAPTLAPAWAAQSEGFASRRIVVNHRGQAREGDVILVPGLASTPVIWDRLAARLEGRFRLHLVAIRGFGDLDGQDNASGAVSGPTAGEILRYVHEAGLHRPAVIGHSMGGQIALRMAAADPQGVGRIMPVDSSPFFAELLRPGATAAEVEPVARLVFQAVSLLGDQALRDQGRAFGLETDAAVENVFRTIGWQGGDRRVLAQSLYEVMTADLRDRLPRVTAPVTVVYGLGAYQGSPRRDMEARLRAAYARLPHPARFVPVAGAEHMVMIDRPADFAQAVERFLG